MVREHGSAAGAAWAVRALVAMTAAIALLPGVASAARLRLADTVAVNTHYGGVRGVVDEAALARLAAAGVARIRNDLDWAGVERTPGVYDFSAIDPLVDAAERAGLRLLLILDYGNALYGPPGAVVDRAGRAAYAAFAAAAAARYAGHGVIWEIWNEPNVPQFWTGPGGIRPDPLAYAALVAAAAPAIRAADPDATILAGAAFIGIPELIAAIGGVGGTDFLRAIIAAGVLEHVDGLSIHSYRAEAPETLAADVATIRAAMGPRARRRPLWVSEWGYSTYDPTVPPTGLNFLPAVSEARQASWYARMLLSDFALGLAGTVIFQDRDPEPADPGNIEAHWGLMHGDLTPKPSYDALATLDAIIGDARYVRRLRLCPGEHALVFLRRDGTPIVALWAESDATWQVRAHGRGGAVLARDGTLLALPDLDRGATLSLAPDDGPIYLVGQLEIRAERSVPPRAFERTSPAPRACRTVPRAAAARHPSAPGG
jgi:hypothetical protein